MIYDPILRSISAGLDEAGRPMRGHGYALFGRGRFSSPCSKRIGFRCDRGAARPP